VQVLPIFEGKAALYAVDLGYTVPKGIIVFMGDVREDIE
jgi:hypothetical protein